MVKFIFLFFLVFILACQNNPKKELDNLKVNKIESLFEEPDNEVDKDQNGCLNTAGYSWSVIKNECIKVHLVGLRLDPAQNQNNEDAQNASYMIFSEDAQKVEIFLPQVQKPLILTKQNGSSQWQQDDFSLVFKDDVYNLLKNDLIIFKGLGQIGPRVTGSDRMEDGGN